MNRVESSLACTGPHSAQACQRNEKSTIFVFFAAIGSQGAVLLFSFQALGLFLSPLTNQGGCGGIRLGPVGSGRSCARRSLRDGGSGAWVWPEAMAAQVGGQQIGI